LEGKRRKYGSAHPGHPPLNRTGPGSLYLCLILFYEMVTISPAVGPFRTLLLPEMLPEIQ
jgi:hypothetical protein